MYRHVFGWIYHYYIYTFIHVYSSWVLENSRILHVILNFGWILVLHLNTYILLTVYWEVSRVLVPQARVTIRQQTSDNSQYIHG